MRYWRPVAAVALAGLVALAASGCWSMSGYQIAKTKLKPGAPKVSRTPVTVRSHVTQKAKEYFFVLVAWDKDSGLSVGNTGKFDLKRAFGKKPKQLVPNSEITSHVQDNGTCGQLDVREVFDDDADIRVKALSTPNQFNNKRVSKKQAVSRVFLRQTSLATTPDPDDIEPRVMIAVGGWKDSDNDGSIDFGESFGCGGSSVSRLNLQKAG